jgi:RNase P subunit RPR2
MKIIKEGLIPEEVVYRTTCTKCDTEFEFSEKEAKVTSDQRDGDYVSIPCPLCKNECTTGHITPKEYTRRKQAGSGYYGHN